MPKVSVIVPVYGVEKYIERCARSLFEQTLDDIEYLCIDDCTPDRSIEILKNVLEEYPNRKSQVIIHRMDQNSGQAAVRKWGILNATGDYIIHCDSDDWVDVDMLEKLYHRVKNKDTDILFCDYFYEKDGISKYVENTIGIDADETIRLFISGKTKASLCMSLVKRSLYGNNNFSFPQYDMTEDMTSLVQLTFLANDIDYIKQAFYHYCFNSSSITGSLSESKCLKRYYDQKGNFEQLWKFFSLMECDRFVDLMKTKQFELRFALIPAIHHWNSYKLFVFGEGGYFRYLFAKNALSRNKIITIVTVLGMHPMFSKIKRLVNSSLILKKLRHGANAVE